MRATLHFPIASLFGNLGERYYIRRMPSGTQVIQRKPNRSNHVPTPTEAANQLRFKQHYAISSATTPRPLRDHSVQ